MATLDKHADAIINSAVQNVQQNHLSAALTEVNNYYKTAGGDSSKALTERLFTRLNQEHLLPQLASGIFGKESDVFKLVDENKSGGLDDRELKRVLSDPSKGSALERMTAGYMLLNSERLSGGRTEITPESLQREAKPDIVPPLDLVFGVGEDKAGRKKTDSPPAAVSTDNVVGPLEKPASAKIPEIKYQERDIASGARVATAETGEIKVTRPDGSSVAKLTVEGKPTMEEKAGDNTSRWTLKEGSRGSKDEVWVSNQVPGVERHNMSVGTDGNLTFAMNGEKHIKRGNGAELVESKGSSKFDFDKEGRIAAVHYPDGLTTFGFQYKGNSEQIEAVVCRNEQTGKSTIEKPDATWGKPAISADGTYSQVAYQMLGDQIFAGKQTFQPNGKFELNILQTDGTINVTDAYGKVTGTRAATAGDFIGTSAARVESTPPQRPADQLEPSSNGADSAKKPGEKTPGSRFEPDSTSDRPASKPVDKSTDKPADKPNDETGEDTTSKRTSRLKQMELDKKAREEGRALRGPGEVESASQAVREARSDLESALHEHGYKNKRMEEILNKLEKRCAEPNGLVVPSPANLARTYRDAADMLNHDGAGIFSDSNREGRRLREKVVVEGLRNLSDPNAIDQGFDIPQEPRPGSCGETNAEKYVAQRDAAAYFSALKQVVQTGSSVVGNARLTPTDVTPGSEERRWSIDKEGGHHQIGNLIYTQDGTRNMASKVFQNLCLAHARAAGGGQNGISHIDIENFTGAITGTPMLTVGPTGSDASPNKIHAWINEDIARDLKAKGRLPALIFSGYHWMSVNDVREVQVKDAYGRQFNQVQVLWDNQYGRARDKGWVAPQRTYTEAF